MGRVFLKVNKCLFNASFFFSQYLIYFDPKCISISHLYSPVS